MISLSAICLCLMAASLSASELSETLNDTAQAIEAAVENPSGKLTEIETLYKDCVSLYEEMTKSSGVGEEEKKALVRLETAYQRLQVRESPPPQQVAPPSKARTYSAAIAKVTEEDIAKFLMTSEGSLGRLMRAISEDAAAMTNQFKKMEEKKVKPEEAKKSVLPVARHFLARGYKRFLYAQSITHVVAEQYKSAGLNSPRLKKSLEKMLLQAGKIDNTIKNAAALYAYYSKKVGEAK